MSASVHRAAEAIKALLGEHNWPYEYDETKNRFTTRFGLNNSQLGSVEIQIRLRPTNADPHECRTIIAYGLTGLRANSGNQAQICEYLTRANCGLAIGNFELDFRDGKIRYKVSLNCRGALPGYSALVDLISIPISMYNRYGDGLLAVSAGTMTAEEAARKADA